MGIDPRRRQKKLERRRAKQKAQRRELARRESGGLPARFQEASTAPILHCWAAQNVWSAGIGHVVMSRQMPHGQVAFAVFLVDRYCLGVKDVFMNVMPRAIYDQRVHDKLAKQGPLVLLKPECARKLIEGAVQYALDLGLPPHPDYRVAKLIFGSISAEACARQFVFGKDGRPFFFSGPNDDAAKCRIILHALHEHCGPDGYHYVLGGPGLALVPLED
ncbi:MAG: hypothetical protein ABR915_01610 [Thermoguttaceae bacterium]|jgi:hypothetical protein